ncbi:MAG: hypothetical protein WAO23_05940 [Dethiobacteria bacterium]
MGKIQDFKDMLNEGRIGFKMDEVMIGEHQFEPGMGPEGKFPLEFRVTWGPKNFLSWIDPRSQDFLTQPLQGVITVGGLCYDAPCEGTLKLDYFNENKIRYTFDFTVKEKDYLFIGEKINIKPWNLPVSHTTCYGTVMEKDTNVLISRSVTFFKLKTAPAFLASFRLA